MLDLIIYKIILFHPTITNIISAFFLILSYFANVSFIRSFSDYLKYWFIRPTITLFLATLIRWGVEVSLPVSNWDLSSMHGLLQVFVLYLLIDFTIYLVHFAMHSNKYLFRLHRVHHSIDELSWENGNKDTIWFELTVILIAVIYSYSLNLKIEFTAMTILLWKMTLAYTHFQKRVDNSVINFFIISPQKHELHHTKTNQDLYNYSLTLTIWDKAFETIHKALVFK